MGLRRDRSFALPLGSLASGVLAYVFFAVVTRALGADDAAPVSVLWTLWSFAGAALAFPVQHWVVRTVTAAGGDEHDVRAALPGLGSTVLGVSVLCTLVALLGRDPLFGVGGVGFPVLVGVLVLGSAYVGLVRGVLAGRRRWGAAGLALVAENGVRVVAAGVLLVAGVDSPLLFGVVLVAAQGVGVLWPSTLHLRSRGGGPTGVRWWSFLGGAASGQLLSQLVLTGGPVVLALSGAAPREVTGLFAALALFRAPYTVAVGSVPQLTARFTRQSVAGDAGALTRERWLLGGATLALAAVALPLGGWLGPPLVELVFGADVVAPAAVCGWVAAGSVLALGGLAATALVMAGGSTRALARAWGAGLAAAAVVLLVTERDDTAVAGAFAAAEAAAFLLLVTARRRAGERP